MTASRAFCLANNAGTDILPETAPWLTGYPIPQFATKDEYRAWSASKDTQTAVFSMIEGVIPALRVGSGNDPLRVHGLVADYDCPNLSTAEVASGLGRFPSHLQPTAWNKTFSGGLRVVWVFEEPIFFVSAQVYDKFIKRAVKELKLKSIAGLDEEALKRPAMYYVAGANWTVTQSAVIRSSLVQMWLHDAVKAAKHSGPGPDIPLPLVWEAVQKKYPGRWVGDFVEGARGCRFWDPSGDANSVIVRSNGVTCFTGNQPFMSWRELLGAEFISDYQEKRTGKAIEELWYDGAHYFRQLPGTIRWDAMGSEVARRHLQVEYGLSGKKEKDEDSSEIDSVLHHIETKRRIEGCAPFALDPNPIVHWNGKVYLNSATSRITPPAETCTGPEEFPELWDYFTRLWADQRNLNAFLGWVRVWVRAVESQSRQRGQVLFIAGGPGTGKSLLSQVVLPELMGGFEDARDFLVDGSKFNNHLFEKGLWCVDDSTVLGNRQRHARFSSLIKAVSANGVMPYEKKYGYTGMLPWCGRVVVTLNDDSVSLEILPDTDSSLLDKVLLLRTSKEKAREGFCHTQNVQMVRREGPKFLRWVRDMDLPEGIEEDTRFGIKAWHDPILLEKAKDSATSASVVELIDQWRALKDVTTSGQEIPISPAMLLSQLEEQFGASARGISLISFGRHLSQAMEAGLLPWVRRGTHAKRKVLFIKIDK